MTASCRCMRLAAEAIGRSRSSCLPPGPRLSPKPQTAIWHCTSRRWAATSRRWRCCLVVTARPSSSGSGTWRANCPQRPRRISRRSGSARSTTSAMRATAMRRGCRWRWRAPAPCCCRALAPTTCAASSTRSSACLAPPQRRRPRRGFPMTTPPPPAAAPRAARSAPRPARDQSATCRGHSACPRRGPRRGIGRPLCVCGRTRAPRWSVLAPIPLNSCGSWAAAPSARSTR
mmetsp:Transcript_43291/g.125143  ORF Transcript_43291/g.125143 Transcript_43291/m.125143 type:complete len:231 (+) Transcript_43291:45-737(+)